MSLFHPTSPRQPLATNTEPMRRLRHNLQANPLAFVGASCGLLAVLAVKILFDRQRNAGTKAR